VSIGRPWGGAVGPSVVERPETRLAVGDLGEGIDEIPRRSRQTVEPCHDQHVAGGELFDRAPELAAVGLGSARHLAEHLFAALGL
jgi:hypothetical protein